MKIGAILLIFVLAGNILGQNQNDYRNFLFNKRHEYHIGAIKRASSKIKIPSLNKAKFEENEAELRIWIIIDIFGIYWVESFILHKENEQIKASYMVGSNEAGRFRFKKHNLNEPKNGWQNLNNFLKSNGIDFDLNLIPERESIGAPDEDDILIEARSKEKYKMYWYPRSTKNADGKKVQQLCSKLVEEFNLDLEEFNFDGSKYKRLKCDTKI